MARTSEFQTIRSEGGLLPADLLRRVLDPRAKLDGTTPQDYGLPQGERLNEVITQAWNRLCRHWNEFRAISEKLPKEDAATGPTNDKWTMPLLRELGFGTLPTSAAPEIDGRTYPIARFHGPVPLHLVGRGLDLDRRTAGARGAAGANPHGMVQEFLNRSQGHLWAVVSNGRQLRILRDNQALSRQSFIEFDLEAMFNGQVYPDFVLMWMVAHVTRFLPREGDRPDSCLLERWTKVADEEGTRALGELRGSVAKALQALGGGFTGHPRNTALQAALSSNQLTPTDLHAQLLRVVYRLIFLFVAEDRQIEGQSLLHPTDRSDGARLARERFAAHYSTARLRELAGNIKGTRHGDLWNQFRLLGRLLSDDPRLDAARKPLALPTLGGFLWNEAATPDLNGAELTNYDFLGVLRHLAFTRQGKSLRSVDFRNLGAEELGGVYESLLELTPQVLGGGRKFQFAEFAGNERKTSGSYYTPDSLVQCLLDTALDPVVNEAIAGKSPREAEAAILALKVCDPAVGSGHFLVGAAHRLARHLSRARALAEGESEPSPLHYQHALRDVIGHCLYGVDINPMSAELCRVGLWLEAMEPGKPLSFLDHHIRVGNSLLGATPELITGGLPDEAFTAIEGDDKAACTALKKLNKGLRKSPGLFAGAEAERATKLARAAANVTDMPDDDSTAIRAKEQAHRHNESSREYRQAKLIADAWCAAFVCEKIMRPVATGSLGRPVADGITWATIQDIATGVELKAAIRETIERLARKYRIFHWHLAFPEVFAGGGFDCVLGNPPWDRIKLQEREWFAERSPEIAGASNAAARKRLIERLKAGDPNLHKQFLDDSRKAEGESHLIRHSGRYPLCGRGDINVYTVFAEGMRSLLSANGAMGAVLPSGLATDDTTKHFFCDLLAAKVLWSFFEFENEGFFAGAGQGHMLRFALSTIGGRARRARAADFVFQAKLLSDLADADRHFELSAEDIALLNPNTRTCPIFRSGRDAEITKAIYRRVPVLIREARNERPEENLWDIRFKRMFDMANDSNLFRTREQLEADGWHLEGSIFRNDCAEYLPLYEAKMVQQYNHRHGDFADTLNGQRAHILPAISPGRFADSTYTTKPFYWVRKDDVDARLTGTTDKRWLVGWRDVTDARASARTVIASVIPRAGVNDKFLLLFSGSADVALLYAMLLSFAFDYAARQKVAGLALKYFTMKQLPALPHPRYLDDCTWSTGRMRVRDWLLPRILELTYTAWDLEPFAEDCGWSGPPFHWDEERRFLLRCELDAAFFHLYFPIEATGDWRQTEGETVEDLARLKASFPAARDAVSYIMDTFPIVRRRDEQRFNGYRTKRVILEIYDAIADSIRTGNPFQTRLDPPPADPRCCHSPKEVCPSQ